MSNYHITQEQAAELIKEQGHTKDSGNMYLMPANSIANIVNAVLDKVLGEQWQPIDNVPVNESVLMLRMGKYGRCGMADGYKQENGVLAWPYVPELDPDNQPIERLFYRHMIANLPNCE